MKKIPTLFIREYDENHRIVNITKEFTNEQCKEAFLNGVPTVKYDGSCCAIIDGVFYKRYDAKKGKPVPEGAIKCQDEPDEVTGHFPCWVKVDAVDSSNKWFMAAFNNYVNLFGFPKDGTYEAVGKHFQGNPYGRDYDILERHGSFVIDLKDRTFEGVKSFLKNRRWEGLVFWLNGEPVCKIKRSDFGMEWPIKR